MPEPTGSDARLQSLRRRWEVEKSTAFLPLAEEYRRLGRLREAIEVLEAGLKSNPGYTSGLVALGRCRLESGDSLGAVQVLERVVKQDPEQMVASKLLIEAYLRTGRAAEARARLEIYTSLNAKDPEIARLQERIVALQPALPEELTQPPAIAEPIAQPLEAPVAAASSQGDAIFVGLDGPAVVSRYLRGLAAEGIFPLAFPLPKALPRRAVEASAAILPAEPAVDLRDAPTLEQPAFAPPALPLPVEPPPAVEPEALTAIEVEPLSPEPVPVEPLAGGLELEPFDADVERAISDLVPVPPPVTVAPAQPSVEELAETPPAAAPMPVTAAAQETATLGDLYLRQGHTQEAERIFGAVLERDPANDLARRGLGQAQEALRQAPGGLSGRRARALRDFLGRLRRGTSHVS